jgi:hypothetical protein
MAKVDLTKREKSGLFESNCRGLPVRRPVAGQESRRGSSVTPDVEDTFAYGSPAAGGRQRFACRTVMMKAPDRKGKKRGDSYTELRRTLPKGKLVL